MMGYVCSRQGVLAYWPSWNNYDVLVVSLLNGGQQWRRCGFSPPVTFGVDVQKYDDYVNYSLGPRTIL